MALRKVSQEDHLIKIIDDMIKDLSLRRAEIVARRPQTKPAVLADTFVDEEGKIWPIKGRKKA